MICPKCKISCVSLQCWQHSSIFLLPSLCILPRVADPDPDSICPERIDPDPNPVNIRSNPQPWYYLYTLLTKKQMLKSLFARFDAMAIAFVSLLTSGEYYLTANKCSEKLQALNKLTVTSDGRSNRRTTLSAEVASHRLKNKKNSFVRWKACSGFLNLCRKFPFSCCRQHTHTHTLLQFSSV